MAAGTRYQAAPTRDSFEDEPRFSQPPPAYQDAADTDAADTDAAIASGVPRSSEDNIPDDFKYAEFVAGATLDIRMAFVRKVYSILTLQLLATAGLCLVPVLSPAYKDWVLSHTWMVYASLFGAIGMMLLTFWKRKSYPTNLVFLTGFTALEAYAVSVVTCLYNPRIVLAALVFTLGIFLALTLFACQSKYDFTAWQPYLFGALWVMILFGFMTAFFPTSQKIELVYGVAGSLIFSGYILVDTQLIMRHYHVEEEIAAAISLYLDVINLFLSILRILNNSNNN